MTPLRGEVRSSVISSAELGVIEEGLRTVLELWDLQL